MTHGNTSWQEFGQTFVDQSRELNQKVTDEILERTERALVSAKEKIKQTEEVNEILKLRVEKAEQEARDVKALLSRPMREIAEISGDFQKAYEQQQQILANWILSQKAYRETAVQLGIAVGKTAEEVQDLVTQNANAVLENRTEHGNDSNTNPLVKEYASTILAIRKKNGEV
ncbi:hypothetical protein H8K47_11360 [Undibacterium sp. CY7W]|uniref:Uncharacterized protein n=1 Tax=Undibacterium rugosum TaxID=2762291 RepID=A0A923KZF1_9BURK|nr:hypothetical protein [Undibacterium rugosum]MBC3935960.1 hypothetical protein [Undibacterium rugosum]